MSEISLPAVVVRLADDHPPTNTSPEEIVNRDTASPRRSLRTRLHTLWVSLKYAWPAIGYGLLTAIGHIGSGSGVLWSHSHPLWTLLVTENVVLVAAAAHHLSLATYLPVEMFRTMLAVPVGYFIGKNLTQISIGAWVMCKLESHSPCLAAIPRFPKACVSVFRHWFQATSPRLYVFLEHLPRDSRDLLKKTPVIGAIIRWVLKLGILWLVAIGCWIPLYGVPAISLAGADKDVRFWEVALVAFVSKLVKALVLYKVGAVFSIGSIVP